METRRAKGPAQVLIPLVYDELRRLARHHLQAERVGLSHQSAALVHEAYLKLVDRKPLELENRAHVFAVAAQLMRQILVDHARKHHAAKRGANDLTLTLDDAVALPEKRDLPLVELDDALNGLAVLDARQCHIVEMRFFGGLSIEEVYEALDISPATVKWEWATARLWRYNEFTRAA